MSPKMNARMSPKMNAKMNAKMSPKMNAKTSAHAHPFSPKIGGDTEGVENLTACTPLTFCRPVMKGMTTRKNGQTREIFCIIENT